MHSEETKKKISEALKNRVLSEEHRAKISSNTKGRKPWNYDPERRKARAKARREKLVNRINKEFIWERTLRAEGDVVYKELVQEPGWVPIARELDYIKEPGVPYGNE